MDNADSEALLGPASELNPSSTKSGGEIITALLVVTLHLECFTKVLRASLFLGLFHSRGSSFKESSPTKLETSLVRRRNAAGLQSPQAVAGPQHPGHRLQGSLGIVVHSFGSNPLPTVKFQPNRGPQLPATLAAVRGVFTFSWRGAGALGPRRGPRRLNNKRGAAKRQEDRTMSKGPGPGGSAASSAPPAATAQVLQAQPEKPQHYTYVEPPPPPRAHA